MLSSICLCVCVCDRDSLRTIPDIFAFFAYVYMLTSYVLLLFKVRGQGHNAKTTKVPITLLQHAILLSELAATAGSQT